MEIVVKITPEAQKQAISLKLEKKLERRISYFKENRRNPILRNKKIEPKHLNRWQFNIDDKNRARYVFNQNNVAEIYAVGDFHDDP